MKNKKIAVLLLTFSMMFSLIGCGNKTQDENVEPTEKIEKEVMNTESIDSTEEVIVPVSTYDGLTFVEPSDAEYSIDASKFDKDIDVSFVAPKDLSLYSSEGIKIAEVKKGVTLHAIASSSRYAWVALENPVENTPYDRLYLLVDDDVDVALASNSNETTETNSNNTNEAAKKETTNSKNESASTNNSTGNSSANNSQADQSANSEPAVGTGAEEATTAEKYTPEEAVAYYRSQVEAQGMVWDPSIKDEASWGSGCWSLSKDELNANAIANAMEGFNYGNGDGTPYRRYYLEITGSDENYVYITQWVA